jgi:small subunit ribosomal protein S5
MAKNHKTDKDKEKDDSFIEKLISVRRVTKVVKGGKNMRFAALVVVGDGKGRVAYATGKAREVPDAVKKAVDRAKKIMVRIPLREARTLHHDVSASVGASKVYLRTAPSGTGVIAGGALRSIFEALGVHDIVAKSVGTPTYHNTVRATFLALKKVRSPKMIAQMLGKKVNEIIARRDHLGHSAGNGAS